jgi:hypothetical protein
LSLGDPAQVGATRQLVNLALERRALCLELDTLPVQLPELHRMRYAIPASPDDSRRNQDESDQHRGSDRSTTWPRYVGATSNHAARSHTRSFALRDRGFRASSSALAITGRRVTTVPNGCRAQVQIGWRGGQRQTTLHSRKVVLTSRSSPEW